MGKVSKPNFYMIILKEHDYNKLRKTRLLRKRGENLKYYGGIKTNDQILIVIKDGKNRSSILAEYEITDRSNTSKQILLNFEPIYHAPRHNGIVLNELMLLKLNTYQNIEEWRKALKNPMINLTEADFKKLSRRLAQ